MMATIAEQLTSLNTNLGTINTEVGTQADLIAQIKSVISGNLIEGGGGATAFTVSSIDELPSNAPNGSLAMVKSDSLIGEWEPKGRTVTPINKSFEEGLEFVFVPFIYNHDCYFVGEDKTDELDRYGNQIVFVGDNTYMEEIEFGNVSPSDTELMEYGDSIYFDDCWESMWRIDFLADTDDIAFKEWVRANFNRLSGGYSLYTRENGEWVLLEESTGGSSNNSVDLEALGALCDWQVTIDSNSNATITIINYHPSYYLVCDIIFRGDMEWCDFCVYPDDSSSYDFSRIGSSDITIENVRWSSYEV